MNEVINDIATALGYSVMLWVIVVLLLTQTEITLRGDIKQFIVFGIGPVWFRISETGPLYSNMTKVGFRIFSRGDWAFGLSLPRWLGRIVRRAGK